MTRLSEHRFFIVGGASKAGTTSVFNYLANHPQIRASVAKETRFFLDLEYPLRSELRYERDGPAAYLQFFSEAQRQSKEAWRLEATPDYLYSAHSAKWIRDTLPNVRLIFLLREPVSRLVSFYRFGQQLNEVPRKMTFDQYVELQKGQSDIDLLNRFHHPVFAALAGGRYSFYLKSFVQAFSRNAIHIAFYEDLRRDPQACLAAVCRWVGIDESYFDDYAFAVNNQGITVRSPRLHRLFFDGRQKARQLLRKRPRLRSVLGEMGRKVNFVYRKMNVGKREEIMVSPGTNAFLSSYYEEEPERLKEMLAIKVPWPEYRSTDTNGLQRSEMSPGAAT